MAGYGGRPPNSPYDVVPLTQPPADFFRERLEEVTLIGLLRRLPDMLVERVGVVADQDAPALGLDAVEDHLGSGGSRHRRFLAERPRPLDRDVLDVLVR